MKYKIKSYGVAKDILGGREVEFETTATTVGALRSAIVEAHPSLQALRSLYVAVNANYADDTHVLQSTDEIVLIPPVSGG